MSYAEAYQKAVNRLEELYKENVNKFSSEELKDVLRKNYKKEKLDPDGSYDDEQFEYEVHADGIISLKRLLDMEENIVDAIEGYKVYRKYPIIAFPSEENGINTSRSYGGKFEDGVRTGGFGDRIDHTLFDLYLYYTDYEKCRLKESYNQPKTKDWLNSFGTGEEAFKNIINHFGIKDIFTDEEYHVYDLSKDNEPLKKEYDTYTYKWDKAYYENVTKKIIEYNKRKEAQK